MSIGSTTQSRDIGLQFKSNIMTNHFSASSIKNRYYLRVKGWSKVLQANGNRKQARVVILILDKTDFKLKQTIRDKNGCYIQVDETLQQKDIKILNVHAPNTRAPKIITQTL